MSTTNNNNNNNIHGLALSILSSTESETFDLGGLSSTTIQQVIEDAFKQNFPIKEKMIRITLVVGAGKLGRQKYDPSTLKVVTQTLSSKLGFQEDRGASCIIECAGLYKVQHDTGKNLKTVVIFPRIATSTSGGGDDNDNDDDEDNDDLDELSSQMKMIAISSMSVFQNMVKSKCWSWSQKKALTTVIENDIISKIDEYDSLLMKGQPLTSKQQSFYDNCIDITGKLQYVKDEMHKHVDEGRLAQIELDQLLQQVDTRIAELEKQQSSLGSNKKKQATMMMLTKANERKVKLQAIDDPIELPKLKHHAELGKLWKQVAPLMHLQESTGQLLSVQETKQLGKKHELLEQIGQLEEASQGWLEDSDTFELRVINCRREFQAKFDTTTSLHHKKKNSKGGGGGGAKGGGVGGATTTNITSSTKFRGVGGPIKWITPQQKKEAAISTKKKKLKKGDVFGAMAAVSSGMDDDDESSSSSSDDEDNVVDDVVVDDGRQQRVVVESSSKPHGGQANTVNTGTSSSKNKKKKNKKKGNNKKTTKLVELDKEISNKKKQQEEATTTTDSTALSSIVISFVKIVYSILSTILLWLIGFLFGTSNKKSKKKKE